MSFRLKTILGIAAIEALLLTILIVSGIHYLTVSNQDQLLQRGHTAAKLVATMTGDAVIAVDLATLDSLVEQTLRNEDIVYLRIRNQSGQVLSQGGEPSALDDIFKRDTSVDQTQSDMRLDVSAPIQIAGTDFGSVELGLSTARLEGTISAALKWMSTIALSEMLLVALAGWVLGTYLTRQLKSLKAGAHQVAAGDFGHQISVKGKDELADTARSFNHMSQSLKDYAEIAAEARRTAEIKRDFAESTLKDALDSMPDGVVIFDEDERVILLNSALKTRYDLDGQAFATQKRTAGEFFTAQGALHGDDDSQYVRSALAKLRAPRSNRRWEVTLSDGRHLLLAQQPMSMGGVVLVETDVTELYQALEQNRQLQLELLQHHKTEALGTLASGMAHELNTPAQFISDNLAFVASGVGDMCDFVQTISKQVQEAGNLDSAALSHALDEADWDFLQEELPNAMKEMQSGTQRIRDQIATFKQFASADCAQKEPVNLREAIQTTLDISKSEWSDVARISVLGLERETEVTVPAQRSQIHQVIHNLLSNSLHAIEDAGRASDGEIALTLTQIQNAVRLEIQDNGCGMDTDQLHRIFDAHYSTKEPGRGTGHGLTLCQTIIERNHGGTLTVESERDVGTTITLTLPQEQARVAA